MSNYAELLKLAKSAINSFFSNKELNINSKIKTEFSNKQGCFVTLTLNNMLRGCIGFPYPTGELWKNIINATKAAAFEDPRFEPLTKEEFTRIKIEISILTEPKLINEDKPENLIRTITVGKDGLIIKKGLNSGLLLPQVATEYGWNALEFLEQTCIKAGLNTNEWKTAKIFTFQADIISE